MILFHFLFCCNFPVTNIQITCLPNQEQTSDYTTISIYFNKNSDIDLFHIFHKEWYFDNDFSDFQTWTKEP